MSLPRRSLMSVLLAALIATIALASGAAARADAAPVQLTNAAQRGNAMEVLGDGTVALRASKPASFRQKWEKEPFGTIGFRFRNLATNACLITPATAINNQVLRVGACGGVGNRNLWRRAQPGQVQRRRPARERADRPGPAAGLHAVSCVCARLRSWPRSARSPSTSGCSRCTGVRQLT